MVEDCLDSGDFGLIGGNPRIFPEIRAESPQNLPERKSSP